MFSRNDSQAGMFRVGIGESGGQRQQHAYEARSGATINVSLNESSPSGGDVPRGHWRKWWLTRSGTTINVLPQRLSRPRAGIIREGIEKVVADVGATPRHIDPAGPAFRNV